MFKKTFIAAALSIFAFLSAPAAIAGSFTTEAPITTTAGKSFNLIKVGGRHNRRHRRWNFRHYKSYDYGYNGYAKPCWWYLKKYKRTGFYHWKKKWKRCLYYSY